MRMRRLKKKPAELEIIAFINLIVVLVPFLLSVAVFSRLAVIDIELPAPTLEALAQLPPGQLQLEVVIRRDAFEVGDRLGGRIDRPSAPTAATDAASTTAGPTGAASPVRDSEALAALSALLLQIKTRYPTHQEATVLAETDTPYDTLVQVMDTLRATTTAQGAQPVQTELFPRLSIGDAPLRSRNAAAAAPPSLPTFAPPSAPTAARMAAAKAGGA
jgi:biopolymer transport protein ExbD